MKIEKNERICAFCELAVPLYGDDTVLCKNNGIVAKNYKCRKFVYDPLKRVPPKANDLPKLEYVDIDD